MSFNLGDINWLSVLVSAAFAFAIGGVWYSPVLFGNSWQKEIGLRNEDLKEANMPMIFGTSFVMNFIGAFALDLLIGKESTMASGICIGSIVGLCFISTTIAINYLFGRKTLKLFLIDAGYFVVFFMVMGAILGAW